MIARSEIMSMADKVIDTLYDEKTMPMPTEPMCTWQDFVLTDEELKDGVSACATVYHSGCVVFSITIIPKNDNLKNKIFNAYDRLREKNAILFTNNKN